MPQVLIQLYRAGRELTSCILRSLPTKCSTATASNLVYKDYIPRSIQSLVAFLPAVPGFSYSGARNPPEVKLPLITSENFYTYALPFFNKSPILYIGDSTVYTHKDTHEHLQSQHTDIFTQTHRTAHICQTHQYHTHTCIHTNTHERLQSPHTPIVTQTHSSHIHMHTHVHTHLHKNTYMHTKTHAADIASEPRLPLRTGA